MVQDVLSKVRRMQPLTLQPPLQVSEGDDHGIDIALVDPPSKIMHAEMTGVAQFSHVVPTLLRAGWPHLEESLLTLDQGVSEALVGRCLRCAHGHVGGCAAVRPTARRCAFTEAEALAGTPADRGGAEAL